MIMSLSQKIVPDPVVDTNTFLFIQQRINCLLETVMNKFIRWENWYRLIFFSDNFFNPCRNKVSLCNHKVQMLVDVEERSSGNAFQYRGRKIAADARCILHEVKCGR